MNQISPHLNQETKITWLEEPEGFPYLRETFNLYQFRSRFPIRKWQRSKISKLIGYSEISVLAKPMHDRFYRRVWYVKVPQDPYPSGCPFEAVKPSSIKIGTMSQSGRE